MSDNMLSTAYRELPLASSIRLVAFEVGQSGSEIRCSFSTADLDDNPPYAALSYTWGDPLTVPYAAAKPSKMIWCDDVPLLVTANLYQALLKIRGFHFTMGNLTLPLRFWIDAICINQHDLAERNAQVAIMGEIYAKASIVISWLGDEDDNSRLAFEIIDRVLPPVMELWESEGRGLFSHAYNSTTLFESLGVSVITSEGWRALVSFFERQYFHRCWIIQEVSLTTKVLVFCGYRIRKWDNLVEVSNFLRAAGWIPLLDTLEKCPKIRGPTLSVPSILSGIRLRCFDMKASGEVEHETNPQNKQSSEAYAFLLRLLLETRNFFATDPRDTIFGIVSIVSYLYKSASQEIQFLRPSYAMSVRDVFVLVSERIIMNTNSVSLLSMVQDKSHRQIRDLPSWVPDFSAFSLPTFAASFEGDRWNLSGEFPESVSISISNDILQLNGMLWDSVQEVGDLDNPYWLQPWLRICSNLPKTYINGQTRVEALWRTLIGDRVGEQWPAPADFGLSFKQFVFNKAGRRIFDALQESLSCENDTTKVDGWLFYDELAQDPSGLVPSMKDIVAYTELMLPMSDDERWLKSMEQRAHIFEAGIRATYNGRKLFRTAEGLLGLGPEAAQVGDSVWFFPSSRVPFILRSLSTDQYELVGETYLHGFMHGEWKEKKMKSQRICII